MTLYIFSAGKSLNTDHLSCFPSMFLSPIFTSSANILLNGSPSISHSFAFLLSTSSRSWINIRYVICSITSSGLTSPPAANMSHKLSILFFKSPVIICILLCTYNKPKFVWLNYTPRNIKSKQIKLPRPAIYEGKISDMEHHISANEPYDSQSYIDELSRIPDDFDDFKYSAGRLQF